MAPCNPNDNFAFFFFIFFLNLAFATIGQRISSEGKLNYYLSLSNVGLLVAGPLLFYFSRIFITKSIRAKFDKLLWRSFICLAFFEVWGALVTYYHFPTFSSYKQHLYSFEQEQIRGVLRESSKSIIVFLLIYTLVFFKRRAIGTIETAYQRFFKGIKRFQYNNVKDVAQLQEMRMQIKNVLGPYKKVVQFDFVFFTESAIFISFFVIYELVYADSDYLPLVLLGIHFFNMWSLKFWPFIGLNSQAWPKFFVGLFVILLSAIEVAVPALITLHKNERSYFKDHDDSFPLSVLFSFKKFNQVLCIVALRAVAKNPIKYIKLYPGFMVVNSLSFGYFYFKGPMPIVGLCFELLMILLITAPDIRAYCKECKGRKTCLYSTNNREIASRLNTIFFTLGYLCLSVCILESVLAQIYDYVALYSLLIIALIFFYYEFIRLIYLPNFQFGSLIDDEKKEVMEVDYDNLVKKSNENQNNQRENGDEDSLQLEEDPSNEFQRNQLPGQAIRRRESTFTQRIRNQRLQDDEIRRRTNFVRNKTIHQEQHINVLLTVMKQYTFLEYDLGELQLSSKIKQEIKNFSKQVEKLPLGMSSFLLFLSTAILVVAFLFFEGLNHIQGFEGSVLLFCAFYLELIMIVYFFTISQRNKYGPYSKSVFGMMIIWLWMLAILPYFCIFPVLLTLFDINHNNDGLEITRLTIASYFILTLIFTVSLYAAIAHKRISLHNKELFLIQTTNSLMEILKQKKALTDKHLLRKCVEACLGVIKKFKEKELIQSQQIMTENFELTSPVIIELKKRLKMVIEQIVKIRNVELIEKIIEKFSTELIGKNQKVKSLIQIDQKKRLANFEKELNSRKKAIQRRKTLLKKMEKQRENCSKLCKSLIQKVELEKKRKKEKKEQREKLIIDQVIEQEPQENNLNQRNQGQEEQKQEEIKEEQVTPRIRTTLAGLVEKFKGQRQRISLAPNQRHNLQDDELLTQIVEEQQVFMQSHAMVESQKIFSPRDTELVFSNSDIPKVLGRQKEEEYQKKEADYEDHKEEQSVIQQIAESHFRSEASPDSRHRRSTVRLLQNEGDQSVEKSQNQNPLHDNEEEGQVVEEDEKESQNSENFTSSSSQISSIEIDMTKPQIQIALGDEKEEENEKNDEQSQDRQHQDSFVSVIDGSRKRIRDLRKLQLHQDKIPPSPLHFGILYSMMFSEPKCQEYFYKLLFNCFADVEDDEGLYVSPDSLAQISKIIRIDLGNKLMIAITKNQKDYNFEEFREMLTTNICREVTDNQFVYWQIKSAILKELFMQTQRRYPDIFFSAKFAGKLIVIHRLKQIEEEEFKEAQDQKLSEQSDQEQQEEIQDDEDKTISEVSSEQEIHQEQQKEEEEKKIQNPLEEIKVSQEEQQEGAQQPEILPRPRIVKPKCQCLACKQNLRNCAQKARNCHKNSLQRLVICCRKMQKQNQDCQAKAKKDLRRCRQSIANCFSSIASCFNNCIVKLTQKCRINQQFKELLQNREDELQKDEQELEERVSEVLKQKHFGYKKRYPPCQEIPSFPQDFAPISEKVLQLEFQRETIKCNCKNNFGSIVFRIIEFFIMSTFSIFAYFYGIQQFDWVQIGQGEEMTTPPNPTHAQIINFTLYCCCCFFALLAALLGFIYRKKILEGQMKDLANQIKKSKGKGKGPQKASIEKNEDENNSPPQQVKESKCSRCQTSFITLYLSLIIVVFNPVIVKYLLRVFMCNEKEYQNGLFINKCYGPRHYATILFSFICLLIFYPIATIIYPGIVYSKFSRNSRKRAELTYKPTFMLTINGYKLLIGALTPILSRDIASVSLRLNVNTLMLFGLLWMNVQSSPCIASNAQKGHIAGFTILTLISLGFSGAFAFYYETIYQAWIFFFVTVIGFIFLLIKIIKYSLKKKKMKAAQKKVLRRKISFANVQ